MKKNKLKISVISALTVAILLCVSVFAANGYDSTADPLITLSYLNDVFMPQIYEQMESLVSGGNVGSGGGNITNSALTAIEDELLNLQARLAALEASGSGGNTATSGSSDTTFKAIEVKKGQTVLAVGSSCELVLRAGSARIVSPFTGENAQGLADFTGGKDLQDGTDVPSNHLLLIPRGDDGRGIIITSSSAWIMVRGEYKIVD
jgi:hypothetical protein